MNDTLEEIRENPDDDSVPKPKSLKNKGKGKGKAKAKSGATASVPDDPPEPQQPQPQEGGLRVAFIHPDLGLGGAERLVVDAARALLEKGHDVKMFTQYHNPNRWEFLSRFLRVLCLFKLLEFSGAFPRPLPTASWATAWWWPAAGCPGPSWGCSTSSWPSSG